MLGIGIGFGYASMPTLINEHTPVHEIAAANGLNTLARSIGTSLASAVGGSILAATTINVGGFELPSLDGVPPAVRDVRGRVVRRRLPGAADPQAQRGLTRAAPFSDSGATTALSQLPPSPA